MNHNPERVREKVGERDDLVDWGDVPCEVEEKLLTSLIGYDPRARLLTVLVLHDEPLQQEDLRARAGVNGLDEFEEAMVDLLRLGVAEVTRAEEGIPFFGMAPESGAGAAVAGANEALVTEQAIREGSDDT